MAKNICAIFCIGALAIVGCSRKPTKAAQSATSAPAASAPAPEPPPAVATEAPSAPPPESQAEPQPLIVPEGTAVRVRLDRKLDTRKNRAGQTFKAMLSDPLVSGDRVVVPKGTEFTGHIVASKQSGRFKGRAVLSLKLDSFTLAGETYDVMSNDASRASGGHKRRNWLWIGGGSASGAMIGAAAGGGAGALIGAGAGSAAGVVVAAVTGKKHVTLPAETPVRFTLKKSVEVEADAR